MDTELPKAFPEDSAQVAENFLKRYDCVWVRTPYPDNEDAYHILVPPEKIVNLWVEAGRRTTLHRLWDGLKDRFNKREVGRLIADDEEHFTSLLSGEKEVVDEDLGQLQQLV